MLRREAWNISEGAALNHLEEFISDKLAIYESSRSLARGDAVSKLSPYLHFGQISPRTVMARLEDAGARSVSKTFWRRLVWRDLAYWQLHHWPDMPTYSIRPAYEDQEWDFDADVLRKWQCGETGFPLVDAGACFSTIDGHCRRIFGTELLKIGRTILNCSFYVLEKRGETGFPLVDAGTFAVRTLQHGCAILQKY